MTTAVMTGNDGNPAERNRILRAALAEAINHGYRETTIDQILDRSNGDAEAFARHFDSLEACLLAAWELLAVDCIARIRRACDGQEDWAAGVRAALSEVTTWLDEQPSRSRFLIVDPLAVGGALEERRMNLIGLIAERLDAGRALLDDPSVLPPRTADWVIGGLYDFVYRRIALGEDPPLVSHLSELVYFATVPYLGPQRAHEQAAARLR